MRSPAKLQSSQVLEHQGHPSTVPLVFVQIQRSVQMHLHLHPVPGDRIDLCVQGEQVRELLVRKVARDQGIDVVMQFLAISAVDELPPTVKEEVLCFPEKTGLDVVVDGLHRASFEVLFHMIISTISVDFA